MRQAPAGCTNLRRGDFQRPAGIFVLTNECPPARSAGTSEKLSAERDVQLARAVGDVNELIAIVAIVTTLERNTGLRRDLRRCANCPDGQPLHLQLPVGSGGLRLRPDGNLDATRDVAGDPTANFDDLVSRHPMLLQAIEHARLTAASDARSAILPVFAIGHLPSRDEYVRLEKWAPLLERVAYRFCAGATEMLDSWRTSALNEAGLDAVPSETVIQRYYALAHTFGHLTLLSSGSGAMPWLSEMARSFAWTHWTPTFPLVRERTVWLAAAAARSAAAFGPDVVDPYFGALSRARHVTLVFDALFALAAIALSHRDTRDLIVQRISAQSEARVDRPIRGADFVGIAYRSALSCLTRGEETKASDGLLLKQLSWRPASLRGLGTREAFRLDPTDVDHEGHMIGFRALRYILQTRSSFHYPLRPAAFAPILPTADEMPELLTRAWDPRQQPSATIH